MKQQVDHFPLTLTAAQAQRRSYRGAMWDEINSWRAMDDAALAETPINHPELIAYKARAVGVPSAGGDFSEWAWAVLKDIAPRSRCLSLGAGPGRIERRLIDRGFTTKFEAIELNPALVARSESGGEGVSGHVGDLNFVTLPANAYDFILCHSILHHLINLEYVLSQVSRALRPDGMVLFYEYVGEDRWQFSESRMAFLRRHFPHVPFRVPQVWEVGGFESVRSSDLLPLIRSYFGNGVVREHAFGGVYFPFTVTAPHAIAEHASAVVALDEAVSSSGELPPCYHVGLYRKCVPGHVEPAIWSDADVDKRCELGAPLRVRIRRRVSWSPVGDWVRARRQAKRSLAQQSKSKR